MNLAPHTPSQASRVRATVALLTALAWVLSFATLSGAALTAAGAVSVAASVLALGYALGVSRGAGRRARGGALSEA